MTETWPEIKRRQQDERIAAVEAAVVESGGNMAKAARSLKMNRASLEFMVRTYDLKPPKQPKEKREEWHNVR
jgi:transcriptional regulator with GAF, ATPase, and Fis domain